MQKRPRQIDVAKLAGVSPATVSVILNNRLDGNVRISEETRARVLDAVEQLGYVTDPVARSLAGGRNSLLGLFASETIFSLPHNAYYPFLVGIEQEAAQLGYDLLLFTNTSSAAECQRIYQGNINRLRMADGSILLGPEIVDTERMAELEQLVAEQYPFIAVAHRGLPDRSISFVAADYVTVTAQIVNEMLVHGHRQILYLGALHDNEFYKSCYEGYLMAHRQLGLAQSAMPAQRISATHPPANFVQQAIDNGVTAFVLESCGDLLTAFFQMLAESGKCAPADLSFAVLGDLMPDFAVPYPITNFSIPRERMGRRAVQLLVELLQTSQSRHSTASHVRQEVLPCIYNPGTSIGPPPTLPIVPTDNTHR